MLETNYNNKQNKNKRRIVNFTAKLNNHYGLKIKRYATVYFLFYGNNIIKCNINLDKIKIESVIFDLWHKLSRSHRGLSTLTIRSDVLPATTRKEGSRDQHESDVWFYGVNTRHAG